MGFWAGTYGLNFCHEFFKLLLKIKNRIALWEYSLFLIGTWKQKLCPNKLKIREK